MADADFYLLDDLWERVCTFLKDGDGKDNNCYLKSVSLVSKKFLAITNRIRFSPTIRKETRPFLTPIFHRFPNLTSLDLSRGNHKVDRNTLLTEISSFPLNITSLNLANSALIPLNGLRAFSQNITTLTSLNCSYKDSISTTDLLLISDCFPLLEELHLSKPAIFRGDFLSGMETLSLALPKLRKVNLSRHTYLNDQLLFQLFNNWKLLEEVIIFESTGITDAGIASALRVRPTLRSLSFHNFFKSDNISTLFALIKSCTSLSDIKMDSPSDVTMKHTCMKEKNAENSNSLVDLAVCPQLKSLSLAHNTWLSDENIIIMFASIFPNLQLLDLSYCNQVSNSLTREKIVENTNSSMEFVVNHQLKSLFLTRNTWLSDENILTFASIFPNLQILDLSYCNQISDSICQVLRCCKLRHLNLAHCSKVKLRGLNFEVLKLEVLNLSYTGVDNEELYLISKSCRGLLQLLLEHCYYVTKRGVNHVVENCTQLREINLKNCYKVHKNIVDSMILSRPSLRKITVPPRYCFNNNQEGALLGSCMPSRLVFCNSSAEVFLLCLYFATFLLKFEF